MHVSFGIYPNERVSPCRTPGLCFYAVWIDPLDVLKNHVHWIRVGLIDPNANQFVTKKERIVSAVVRINILGPLQILFDNAEATLNGVKLRNVLTILAFRANGEVLRDELIDELNLMETTSDAANALHAHMARLRRWFRKYGGSPDLLETVDSRYRLRVERAAVDAHRFVELAERAMSLAPGSPSVVASMLEDALSLWRGEALVDALDGPLGIAAADELNNWRAAARETLLDAWLSLGSNQQVIVNARKFIAENPLNESMYARYIHALCEMGRYAEAVEAYRNAAKVLHGELGVAPGAELRAAVAAVSTFESPGNFHQG